MKTKQLNGLNYVFYGCLIVAYKNHKARKTIKFHTRKVCTAYFESL